jgi:hypothetical protein
VALSTRLVRRLVKAHTRSWRDRYGQDATATAQALLADGWAPLPLVASLARHLLADYVGALTRSIFAKRSLSLSWSVSVLAALIAVLGVFAAHDAPSVTPAGTTGLSQLPRGDRIAIVALAHSNVAHGANWSTIARVIGCGVAMQTPERQETRSAQTVVDCPAGRNAFLDWAQAQRLSSSASRAG